MVISLEEINPLERLNALIRAKNQNKRRNVKILITSFQGVNKVKTDIFINVIYRGYSNVFVEYGLYFIE